MTPALAQRSVDALNIQLVGTQEQWAAADPRGKSNTKESLIQHLTERHWLAPALNHQAPRAPAGVFLGLTVRPRLDEVRVLDFCKKFRPLINLPYLPNNIGFLHNLRVEVGDMFLNRLPSIPANGDLFNSVRKSLHHLSNVV